MKWFYNLKIAKKLVTGFVIVAIIAVIIGGIGIFSLQKVNESYKSAYTDSVDALEYVERISSSYQGIRVNVFGLFLAETLDDKDYFLTLIGELKNTIDENIANYREMLSEYDQEEVAKEIELIDAVQEDLIRYGEKRVDIIETVGMDVNRREEAIEFLKKGGELNVLSVAVDNAITELIDYNINYSESQIASNVVNATVSTVSMGIVIAIGFIVAIILGLYIARVISKPINRMALAADKLALGDVDVDIKVNTNDEIGNLADSFSAMIANIRNQALAAERIAAGDLTVEVDVKSENDLLGKKLSELIEKNNEVMTNIASASEQVAAGSKQVSDSSMALSQGATEQASSIEELTASLEEISSQTNLNAKNANRANELAVNAKSNAVLGNNQMKEMLKAMEEINESSTSISNIIKVIDEIAFQTNILALNAAVEAARAGQHGKGFAVVAEEVRNLAARAANAAKETTEMIEGSINKTVAGTKIAKNTAEALNKIVNGIETVADLVNNIAVASNEQDTGIAQVNQGIMQVSEVVQTNSATSEESAAASEELSSQAELLREMVTKFKLKQNMKSGKIDVLSPEIIKMLEGMSEKKKKDFKAEKEDHTEKLADTPNIVLNDNDFGKY